MSPAHPFPDAVMGALRCPVCRGRLGQDVVRLVCGAGHSFDRAKQGHVTLRTGTRTPVNADTAAMVVARAELLGTGLYEPIREAAAAMIADAVDPAGAHLVADLAGGTGYYLAGVLDRLPASQGLCLDLSAAALQRAARCHPRMVAVGADLSGPFPLADDAVTVAMSVFGPRNAPEIARILRSDGALLVVTPTARHLEELRAPLAMLAVDPRKDERLRRSLGALEQVGERLCEYREQLAHRDIRALVAMGPSAHHIAAADLDARISGLPARVGVTVSVTLRLFRPGAQLSRPTAAVGGVIPG